MDMIYVENAKVYRGMGFYIDKTTPLGNMFPLDLGRDECIDLYRRWLCCKLRDRGSAVWRYFDFLRREYMLRKEIHLICHCKPLPCHGDVIKELIMRECR